MRLTPLISKMTPEQIMRKRPFTVPIPAFDIGVPTIVPAGASNVLTLNSVQYELCSQADFVREYFPTSHKINSIKYYPNTLFVNRTNGSYQAKVRSRVAVGFQQYIHLQRKEALLGNNVGMRLVSGATDQKKIDNLARLREGWEEKDMEVVVNDAIDSSLKLAETAVFVFMDDNKVHSRVFSYDKGDTLYPHYDSLTGEMTLLGRLYTQTDWDGKTHQCLDVVDKTDFVTYIQEDNETWKQDGEKKQHGFPFCPVAYYRSDYGPAWSASQQLIDSYELAMSQFAENNAAYALRILYTLGGELEVMTNTDGTPSRIDSPDANAKVGFLEPAEGADGAFAKQLELMKKEILRASFVVETPEIKSGADISSRTVKMMFADSYMKALSDSMVYQPFLNRVLDLFKYGYLLENGKISDYETYKVKAYLDPFIFMSENDIISSIQMLVTSGCMSKQTATELAYNIGYSSPDEIRRLTQEAHDELIGTAATADPQTNNPVNLSRQAAANA